MRANEPVYWDETNELWGISRYDDVVEIEKRKDVFINSRHRRRAATGPTSRPTPPSSASTTRCTRSAATSSPAASRPVPPRPGRTHPSQGHPASSTPSQAKGGTAEIVNEMAAPLPAMMIGKLLGFDEDDWPKLKHWSETTIAMGGGPRYFNEVGMTSAMEFAQACADLFAEKRPTPATTC